MVSLKHAYKTQMASLLVDLLAKPSQQVFLFCSKSITSVWLCYVGVIFGKGTDCICLVDVGMKHSE